MKIYSKSILLFCIFLIYLIFVSLYIGYAITLVCSVALAGLVALLILGRKDVIVALKPNINRYSIFGLLLIVIYFIIISTFFLRSTELIFFDEQIYQSVALNILNHGNALPCLYGTSYLKSCYVNYTGFDPSGWPFLIAIPFALFGAGQITAHGLEISISAMSIVAVFLLSSIITNRKEIPIISAAIFATIPEVFIWSGTLANPNTPFMLFSIITVLLSIIFIKTRTKRTLWMALFSMVLTAYLRLEALILIPILLLAFLTFGGNDMKRTFIERVGQIKKAVLTEYAQSTAIVLLILLAPELIFINLAGPQLLINTQLFLKSGLPILSISYLPTVAIQNLLFLMGGINAYPAIFLPEITILAMAGAAFLFFDRRGERSRPALLLLSSIFVSYFIFYGMYFSGSALSGTSVRFLLILFPSLSILAAFGVYGVASLSVRNLHKARTADARRITVYALCFSLIALFFVLPFIQSIPYISSPNYAHPDFPVIGTASAQNGPYAMSYANRSLTFINDNYNLVPAGCLVFSPSPYLWYGLNRSAAYVSEYNASGISMGNHSCFVLDYSWFCGMPFNNTACNSLLSQYKVRTLATEYGDMGSNFSLYELLNYTPH